MTFVRRLFFDQHGSDMVESAGTIPVLMLALLAIIQMGTLVYARQSAEEAARYGVRRGVVNVGNPVGAAVDAADQYASTALPWGHSTTVEAPGGIVGSTMRLRVTTNPPNIINAILSFFHVSSTQFQISAIAEGRMEGW